jgi:hypothetical protein
MTKFGKAGKTGLSGLGNWVSGFGSFRIVSKNELNMNIWRSKYVWSMEKERRNFKVTTHVLTTKYDILGKLECPICQIRTSSFCSDKMVNIYEWMPSLYISHVFRLCMCFSNNLVEFHWRNKEVLQTTRRWTPTKDLKLPWWIPHRGNQTGYMEHMILSSDEEVMSFWKYLRLQNRRFWFGKPDVPVFMGQTRIWVEVFITFG